MKIAVIKKEFGDEDVKAFRKNRRQVPAWLYERPEGTAIRVKPAELSQYSTWLEEKKPKRSTKKSASAAKPIVSGSSE